MTVKESNKMPYLIIIAVFLTEYLISDIFLRDVFLPRWTSHQKYLYLWVICLLLIHFEKHIVSFALLIGNTLGLFIGQILGDYLRAQRMLQITEDMEPEQVYHLGHHSGVELWLLCILISLILGIIIHKIKKRKAEKTLYT